MGERLQRETNQVLKCLTQWEWLRIHEDVKELLSVKSVSSTDPVNFCKDFLITSGKCLANGFDINLVQITGLQQLIKAAQTCHGFLLVDGIYVNLGNLQVLKSLYHILYKVLPLDHSLALDVAEQLTKELNIHTKCSTSVIDLPKDVTAVLQNAYLLLWNRAQIFDQDKKQVNTHVHALNLRLKALQFLFMVSTDCIRFCEQATNAAKNHQSIIKSNPCPYMETFYRELFSFFLEMKIVKSEHISSSVTPKLLSGSIQFLISWINYLYQRSSHQAEKTIMDFNPSVLMHFTKFLPKCSPLSAVVSFCIDMLLISTHLCQIASESKLPLSTDIKTLLKKRVAFDKITEEFRACWESCCSLLHGQLCSVLKQMQVNPKIATSISLHLMDLNVVLDCIVTVRILNTSETTAAMNRTFTIGDLGYYCSFYQVLLSICAIALDHYDKTNSRYSDVVQAALSIARQFSQLVKGCHHSYGSHYVANVWPIGSKCFMKGLFSEALKFYKTCYKFIKKSIITEDSKTTLDVNFQYIKVITVCFCNMKDYLGALNFLAEMMSTNNKHSRELLEQWAKVKRDLKAFALIDKARTTTVKLVLTFAPKFKRKDLVSLLMEEFEAYRNYDAQEEKLAVMMDLLDEENSMDNFHKAVVLVDYAELQLITDINPNRSPRACCIEAIDLLEHLDSQHYKRSFPSEKDCLLAHAFFVLHLYETRENQAASETEVINQNISVAAAAKRNSTEVCSSCNIPPAYLHITMEVEFNLLFYLDKSLDMWTAIVTTNSKNINNAAMAINDLKTIAEMYSLVRMVAREIQAWKLVLEVTKTFSNIVEWGNSVARLVSLLSRNGLTHEASGILREFKPRISELQCNSESQPQYKRLQLVNIYLLLAESELLLMKSKVCEGWEYLRTVHNNLTSSKASVLTTIAQCEANLLSSKFCELPSSVLKLTPDPEDSPIILATRSLTSCLDLVKSIINRKDFKFYRCMELKPRLINLLMECALRVGYLFQDIGAPRESSCFLKEQLLWAQKLSLANRSAELLLALSKLDIISGHYAECQSKLHSVQFIIESPGKQLKIKQDMLQDYQGSDTSSENIADDCGDFVSSYFSRRCLAQQSEGSTTCSPIMKNRSIFLNWQQHSSSCLCTKCKQVVFHRLRLELAFAQTECHFYSLDKLGASKAMESMSTILSYAESWRKIEHALLLEMASNPNSKVHKGSNKRTVERPLLQLDVITCNALCKLTQMRLHKKDPSRAHLAIKSAYSKVCNLFHTGLAQTHYLLANIIYFYCVVKLNLFAANKALSVSQFLNQKLWSSSETACFKSSAEDMDFLTANIDNIHITSTDKLADCFKTPRNVAAPMSKYKSSHIKDAPVKAVPTLSAFEIQFSDSEVQILTPVKPPKSIKNLSKKKKNIKLAVSLETECDEKLDATIDLLTPEKCTSTKTSIVPKLFTISNQENSDADIRSPVKKTPNGRPVLGASINDNFGNVEKGGQIDKPGLLLCVSSSPETPGSSFISAANIRKAPKASRAKKLGSTSSTASVQSETVRQSLRCRARARSETVSSSPITAEVVRYSDFDDVPVFTSEILVTALSIDTVQALPQKIDNCSKASPSDRAAREAVHLLFNELETVRGSSPAALTTEKTVKPKTKPSAKKARAISKKNDADSSIDKVIVLLEKAVNLTCHHPHMPLYSDLNLLLILCKGENDESKVYNLFESMALTLRHQANYILTAKLSKLSVQTDKGLDNPNADNSRLKERRAIMAFPRNIDDWNTSIESVSSKLNKEWTVCQINVVPSSFYNELNYKNHNPELIITRLQKNCKPVIVKTSSKASLGGVNNFSTEFDSIVQESTVGARLTDRNLWWSKRRDVDNRLKALVKSIEDYWLGHWKGLLLGNPAHEDDRQRLKEITDCLAKEIRSKGFEKFNENLLEVIVNSYSFLENSLTRRALAEMLCSVSDDKRIKELCMIFKKKCACLCSNIIQRQHVVLILDKDLQKFPWENLPILYNSPVSRMPSIHFLLGHLALYGDSNSSVMSRMTIDTSNAYYVLNPGNDLPNTEKLLSVTFKSLNWKGVTGRPPTSEEWSSALSECDLFLYNGHGSGSQYVSLNSIQKSECRACVFLIGCSSGKLKSHGHRLEMDGIALHYLLAGSPVVVGNLWDVTDKAIDKFLEDLLKYWLPGTRQRDPSLCQAIISARADCNLLFAIGAAPVMYGIPIQAKKR